jgi:rhodanese-related sulfurtransferase
MNDSPDLPLEIDVKDLDRLRRERDEFVLLDVREAYEFAIARIEGSVLVPMSEIGDRLDELEEHRQRVIVVHCHHGIRSLQVTHALRSRGFPRVHNLAGGIDRWSRQIDPTVPTY